MRPYCAGYLSMKQIEVRIILRKKKINVQPSNHFCLVSVRIRTLSGKFHCVTVLWSTVQIFQQFEEGVIFFYFSVFSVGDDSIQWKMQQIFFCCCFYEDAYIAPRCFHFIYYGQISSHQIELSNHFCPHIGASAFNGYLQSSVKNPVNLKPDVACFLHLSSIMTIASCRHVALCSCLSDHRALL